MVQNCSTSYQCFTSCVTRLEMMEQPRVREAEPTRRGQECVRFQKQDGKTAFTSRLWFNTRKDAVRDTFNSRYKVKDSVRKKRHVKERKKTQEMSTVFDKVTNQSCNCKINFPFCSLLLLFTMCLKGYNTSFLSRKQIQMQVKHAEQHKTQSLLSIYL